MPARQWSWEKARRWHEIHTSQPWRIICSQAPISEPNEHAAHVPPWEYNQSRQREIYSACCGEHRWPALGTPGALVSPKGITRYSQLSSSVLNAVFHLSLRWILTSGKRSWSPVWWKCAPAGGAGKLHLREAKCIYSWWLIHSNFDVQCTASACHPSSWQRKNLCPREMKRDAPTRMPAIHLCISMASCSGVERLLRWLDGSRAPRNRSMAQSYGRC